MKRGAHTGLLAFVFALAGGASAAYSVPPPGEQVSADCQESVYATDHLVCSDATLRALDEELLNLWTRAKVKHPLDARAQAAQAEWFRTRSLCAFNRDHRQCVVTAYQSRINVLRLLLGLR